MSGPGGVGGIGMTRVVRRQELAEMWGISANVIDNMLTRGQLRRVAHGLIDLDHAEQVRAAQDPVERERALMIKAQQAAVVDVAPPFAQPATDGNSKSGSEKLDLLLRARTAKVVHDARNAELHLKVQQGVLLDKAEVHRGAFLAGQLLVSRLKALPSRLGSQCASIRDAAECERLVGAEIDQIVTELQDALAGL